MTSEQKYFIQILSDHLAGRESCPPEDVVDWEEIVSAAKKHDLAGIVWHQCHKLSPLAEALYGHCRNSLYNYGRRVKTEEIIKTAFRNSGIESFVVKGSAIATYYPVPAYRTMGDTDFVVRGNDFEQAHNCLITLGFVCRNVLEQKERIYCKKDFFVELHHGLYYSENMKTGKNPEFFNTCWEHIRDGYPERSFHTVYLLDHLRKHLVFRGAGFRQFMDIAVLTKNCNEKDWAFIESKLIELGLRDFSSRVFAINEKWFGVAPPIECTPSDDAFYEEVTSNIYLNGVFGFNNSENDSGENVIAARNSKHKKLGMLRRALHFFFPTYDNMKRNPPFAFVKGRPYLLPVAWVYRIFRSLFLKQATKGIQTAKKSFISDEEYAKREEWLKSWRL